MLKMIIADDERVIRESISRLIDWEKLGVELTGLCRNGLEAYDMIIDEDPDIVLTDIRMPGMDGLELIRKVSLMDLDTRFILLSGYGEFEYAKEAMKYGVKHYLLKPYFMASADIRLHRRGREGQLCQKTDEVFRKRPCSPDREHAPQHRLQCNQ